ncbi:31241_t:CDS:2, partial [Racocetra persica]
MAQSQLHLSSGGIPNGFNILALYNPRYKYNALMLMSTKKRPVKNVIKNKSPPRPPNLFFLFKNAFMLEFKEQFPQQFEKLSMPNLCKCTQELWKTIPSEVKAAYAKLAVEAQSIHNELYPDYEYKPRKRNGVRAQKDSPMSGNLVTFSSTSLYDTLSSENSSSILQKEDPQITISQITTSPVLEPQITSPVPEPQITSPVPEPQMVISPVATPTTSFINSSTTTSLINSPITTSLINSPITTSLINSPITSSTTTSLINSPITPSEGSPLVPEPRFVMSPDEVFGFPSGGSHFISPDASTFVSSFDELVNLVGESIISGGALGIDFPNRFDNIIIPPISYDNNSFPGVNYSNYSNNSMPDEFAFLED